MKKQKYLTLGFIVLFSTFFVIATAHAECFVGKEGASIKSIYDFSLLEKADVQKGTIFEIGEIPTGQGKVKLADESWFFNNLEESKSGILPDSSVLFSKETVNSVQDMQVKRGIALSDDDFLKILYNGEDSKALQTKRAILEGTTGYEDANLEAILYRAKIHAGGSGNSPFVSTTIYTDEAEKFATSYLKESQNAYIFKYDIPQDKLFVNPTGVPGEGEVLVGRKLESQWVDSVYQVSPDGKTYALVAKREADGWITYMPPLNPNPPFLRFNPKTFKGARDLELMVGETDVGKKYTYNKNKELVPVP